MKKRVKRERPGIPTPPTHTHTCTLSLWRGTVDTPFSLGAWREELRSSGLIMMGPMYQAKRLYFNPVAKITSSWGNLHFHNAAEHLIVPQWAKIVMVLLKPNYNEA